MKDNRIYRPELLNKHQKDQFFDGLDLYLKNKREQEKAREEKRKTEIAAKIASGEYIEKDGKLYDARFFKG